MKARGAHTFSQPFVASCFFVLAFALRIVFSIEWQDMPYGTSPLLDAQMYDKMAWSMADGSGLGGDVFYQSPLYPYILSFLYRIVGHSYFAASLLNDVLDSGTVVLLCLIAHRLFGRTAAVSAGVIAAFFVPMIFFTAPTMKEPLTLFLLAFFVLFALRALENNLTRDYIVCGTVLGLAILARGNALMLVPVTPIFAFMRHKRVALRGIGCFVLAGALAIVPVTWHNFRAAHDFVPLTYDEGFNLYIGHSPYANGTNAYPPELSTSPEQEKLDVVLTAERESGHKLKPSEVSAYWRNKAFDFALDHPQRELQLFWAKLFAFWNDADDVDNYDMSFIKENFSSILNLPLINFGIISALCAFTVCGGGWRLGDKTTRWGFAFLGACGSLYMGSLLVFYVTDRYRLPVVVFLIPLAAAAVPCALAWIRQGQKKNLAAALCGSILFLGLALHAPLDRVDLRAFDWGVLTSIYADKGEVEKAFDAFHRGVGISAPKVGAQAYIHIAQIYERLGQSEMATKLVERAVEIYPQDGVALYNLGRLQASRGDIEGALVTLQKAQKLTPDYTLTYFALAKIYQKKGQRPLALEALQNGLFVDPEDPYLLSLKQGIDLE